MKQMVFFLLLAFSLNIQAKSILKCSFSTDHQKNIEIVIVENSKVYSNTNIILSRDLDIEGNFLVLSSKFVNRAYINKNKVSHSRYFDTCSKDMKNCAEASSCDEGVELSIGFGIIRAVCFNDSISPAVFFENKITCK